MMFFTWKGTTEEVKSWIKKYKKACEKNGITYKGYYAPPQDPYHWVIMTDNEIQGHDNLSAPFREVGYKPPQMDVMIVKYYAPQTL
jgi:hypothetical protein